MARKIVAVVVVMVLVMSLVPGYAVNFVDLPDEGHWAYDALEAAVDNGILNGSGDKLNPWGNLKRAEMAAIISRVFGAVHWADISSYTDVVSGSWYYSYMALAVQMQALQGDGSGRLRPEDNITRQEAFTVLARAFKLSGGSTNALGLFSDNAKVSAWAVSPVASLVEAGYIQGSGGKLNPLNNITRAEFSKVLHNMLQNYITEAGTYTEVGPGNVMVNSADVILKDLTVKGDLIIGDGVDDGTITLDNVTVEGRLVVRGGGENSIRIIGGSSVRNIIVARIDGVVRVFAEDGTEVGAIVVDGNDDVIVEGDFDSVVVLSDGVVVTANNATIDDAVISGARSSIIVGKGSAVATVTVNGANGTVGGEGKVTTVNANANSVKVTNVGTIVKAAEGTTSVMAGDKAVEGGAEETVATPPATGGIYVPPAPKITVAEVNVVDGGDGYSPVTLPVIGQVIIANIELSDGTIIGTFPANEDAEYKWYYAESTDTILGTTSSYTVTSDNVGKTICVEVSVDGYEGTATWTASYVVPSKVVRAESSIQTAIDNAKAGDIIIVEDGSFNENLTISKAITLKSLNRLTTITGTITISANNVTVDGFTVEPADSAAPVIHMIGSENVKIINNTVTGKGYASIGTEEGPAKVTGIISGNTVTGMIIVGTDGALEVSDNNITATSSEGICFYPVGPTAVLTAKGNTIGAVGLGFTQIKVNERPTSINGITNDLAMVESLVSSNSDATVKMNWFKYINTDNELIAAIAGQEDGQVWLIAEGTYDLPVGTEMIKGQAGWYFPITADNLTIVGVGNPVLSSSSYVPNGSHASQNLITVWGNGVTFKGLTIEPKVQVNKTVEVSGKDFTITDCTFRPNTLVTGDNANTTGGGSLYFSGEKENVQVKNNTFINTFISFDNAYPVGTPNVIIANNTWNSVSGYAIGNVSWGANTYTKQYVEVAVTGNSFNGVTDATKIIASRMNQTFTLDGTNTINGSPIKAENFGQYINFNNLAYWLLCKDNKVVVDSVTFESPFKEVDVYVTNTAQLQAAIAAATEDVTICLAVGIYDDIISIQNKSVTILGIDKEGTKIKAISAAPGEGNSLTVKNLTVYGNNGSGQSYAGIFISNGDVTIENCRLVAADGTDTTNRSIETQFNNAANITVVDCYLSRYKGPYFNPTTGTLTLLRNEFNGSGLSVDTITRAVIEENTNLSIGLFIGYGLLDVDPSVVLKDLNTEIKAFAIALHNENLGATVKLSTNSKADSSIWGGFITAVEDDQLVITETYPK